MTAGDFLQQSQALIPAEVRMISGCHSEQTSADVSNVKSVAQQLPDPAGRAGGACTSALLEILYGSSQKKWFQTNKKKQLTFQDLLLKLRESLASKGFDQVPQLTSSRPLELQETPFHLVGGHGARRAVLVGINYRGQSGELSGCHNDVWNVKKYIMNEHGFPDQDIIVLCDDGRHPYPTRRRIIAALQELVVKSAAGDSVYFHYSGHGGLLLPDLNFFKTKNDDYDETLYPVDHERSGQIRDFSLFNNFVKPMAAGVTVTCVMDCCHSGSVLELPYSFRPTDGGTIRMQRNMTNLSNLAFLYILAGGILPHGFEGITDHIGDVIGGDVDTYQGTGIEGAQEDFNDDGLYDEADYAQGTDGVHDNPDSAEELASPEYGMAGADDASPIVEGVVVPGMAVPEDMAGGTPDVVEGVIVPGIEVPETGDRGYGNGGYDDANGAGEYGDVNDDFGGCGGEGCGDDGGDADCGCVADVLSSLLDD